MKLYKSILFLMGIINYSNCYITNLKMNLNINNNLNNLNNFNNLRRNLLFTSIGLTLTKSNKANAYANAYINNNKNIPLLKQLEEEQKNLFNDVITSVCYISTEYTSMGEKFNLNKDDLPKGVGSGFIWFMSTLSPPM